MQLSEFGFSQIEQLEIEQIAAQRSFLWIWCGSGEGLDLGRKVSGVLTSVAIIVRFPSGRASEFCSETQQEPRRQQRLS